MLNLSEGTLLGVGNPLLDIIVKADESLLKKYNLKPNNAIIAGSEQLHLLDEITQEPYIPEYVAGGAAQNSIRICQWVLKKPNICVYMGSVGCDKNSEILAEKATEAGVSVKYQYHRDYATGTCASLVIEHNRSLCATLGAANNFTVDHMHKPENLAIIEKASYYYIGGFFLTVSPESAMFLAEKALNKGKILSLNLSADYICKVALKPLTDLLPYVDILFGNETEALAVSEALNFGTTNYGEIALRLTELPHKNPTCKRIVIVTQGHLPVIIAKDGVVKEMAVEEVPKDQILDTTGAGDAFVGGFLSQFMLEKTIEDCVKCGIWAATHVITKSGCTFDPDLIYPGH